ncbi:hypothetical protein GCM10027346_43170 [Hymenobacter seoulensis]
MQRQLIANRSIKVYPDGAPNLWHRPLACRFGAAGAPVGYTPVAELDMWFLGRRLVEFSFYILTLSHLYLINGRQAFSPDLGE